MEPDIKLLLERIEKLESQATALKDFAVQQNAFNKEVNASLSDLQRQIDDTPDHEQAFASLRDHVDNEISRLEDQISDIENN